MEAERFLQFTQTIDSLQKEVQRIKIDYAPAFGIKSLHIFWLCALRQHPEGLTPSMLAKNVGIDRSLVSRELRVLEDNGFIRHSQQDSSSGDFSSGDKRCYNTPILLTEAGAAVADHIISVGSAVQKSADEGISDEELDAFYETAKKLLHNLSAIRRSGTDHSDNAAQ